MYGYFGVAEGLFVSDCCCCCCYTLFVDFYRCCASWLFFASFLAAATNGGTLPNQVETLSFFFFFFFLFGSFIHLLLTVIDSAQMVRACLPVSSGSGSVSVSIVIDYRHRVRGQDYTSPAIMITVLFLFHCEVSVCVSLCDRLPLSSNTGNWIAASTVRFTVITGVGRFRSVSALTRGESRVLFFSADGRRIFSGHCPSFWWDVFFSFYLLFCKCHFSFAAISCLACRTAAAAMAIFLSLFSSAYFTYFSHLLLASSCLLYGAFSLFLNWRRRIIKAQFNGGDGLVC